MELSPQVRKFQSGKNDSSSYSIVLRSACQRSGCYAESSGDLLSSSVSGSPTLLKSSKFNQELNSHHHHHHHHHHHQQHDHQHLHQSRHSHSASAEAGLSLHDNNNEHHQERIMNWVNSDHKSSIVQSKVINKKSAKLKSIYAFSDYSSGNEETDFEEEGKTGYTYAKSASYSGRVTPTRICPSPNMSRTRIRSAYSEEHSSDEADHILLKAQSHLTEETNFQRTSTPNNIKDSSMKLYTNFQGRSSYLHWISSLISSSLYSFICFMVYTDVWILSRSLCSKMRSIGPALLPFLFLLPLLLLLLAAGWLPEMSSLKRFYSNNLNIVPKLQDSQSSKAFFVAEEMEELKSQWQSQLEQKWLQELEKNRFTEAQQMKIDLKNQVQELESKWHERLQLIESRWNEQENKWSQVDLNKQQVIALQTILKNLENSDQKRESMMDGLSSYSQVLSEEVQQLKLKIESQQSDGVRMSSVNEENLLFIKNRVEHIESKQKVLEDYILGLKNCCKKQESIAMGVSQAEFDIGLASLAQEVRNNISQLVLMKSTAAMKDTSGASGAGMGSTHSNQRFNSNIQCPTYGEVQNMVRSALYLYDADKTGLVDYALESAGGSVVSTRCTETYSHGTAQFSLFGVPFWKSSNTPRTVIQPQVHPGECWAMRGTQGYLVILLSAAVRPTAFTLEHIPKELSPTGKIDSAPKEFSVWGLTSETDSDGHMLGKYTYNDFGEPLQTFVVQETDDKSFSIVELRIHSNHGNPDYTCLYRFRVHGIRQ